MRFEEMVLAEAGDEVRLRFDPNLTVLAGVGPDERAEFIASVLDALTGEGRGGAVRTVDQTGRPMEIRSGGGRVTSTYADDGTAGPRPLGWLAPDVAALRKLVAPASRDLDTGASTQVADDDPPALAAAKADLRNLDEQRRMAASCREQADASAERVREIEASLREAEATAGRRAYLAATNELKQVRAEAEALKAGVDSERVDEHLVAQAANLDRLDRRWREAHNLSAVLRRRLGESRFDDVTVRRMASVPAEAPPELARTLQEATMTRARVATLEDRLRTLATGQLPPPEDPRVLGLATADQRELWDALSRLEAARAAADAAQIRIGGMGARRNEAVETLEEAHGRWEDADRVLAERRVMVIGGAAILSVAAAIMAGSSPAVALLLLAAVAAGVFSLFARPWQARTAAAADEQAALLQLGAPTYLAFHLRRVDATFDSSGRDQAELAGAALVLAEREWRAVAGEVPEADARAMRGEVQSYAAALQLGRGTIDEITEIRQRLVSQAIPERDDVHARLVSLLAPYRVEPQDIEGVGSEVVAATVAARIDMGSRARQQQAVEAAEQDERDAATDLGALLVDLGQGEGDPATRVEAARWAIEQATARQAVRSGARSVQQIDDDIARLDAEVKRLHRPEYAIGMGAALPEVDVDALVAERSKLQISLADMERVADTIGELDERRREVQEKIAALAQELGLDDAAGDGMREALLHHLSLAAQGGPSGEPVPVVLDDPVAHAPEERRWELMDLLRRLSERTQVIYLTGDAWIGAWARRRAQIDETILLLEPVE